jgi:hypothetical protein
MNLNRDPHSAAFKRRELLRKTILAVQQNRPAQKLKAQEPKPDDFRLPYQHLFTSNQATSADGKDRKYDRKA